MSNSPISKQCWKSGSNGKKGAVTLWNLWTVFFFSSADYLLFLHQENFTLKKKKENSRETNLRKEEESGENLETRIDFFRFGCFSSQLFFFPLFTLFSIQTEYGFLCGGLITVTSCLSHLLGWDKEDSIQGWTGIIRGDKKVVAFRRAIEIKRNTTLYDSFRVILGCSFIDLLGAQRSVNRYERKREQIRTNREILYPLFRSDYFRGKGKIKKNPLSNPFEACKQQYPNSFVRLFPFCLHSDTGWNPFNLRFQKGEGRERKNTCKISPQSNRFRNIYLYVYIPRWYREASGFRFFSRSFQNATKWKCNRKVIPTSIPRTCTRIYVCACV